MKVERERMHKREREKEKKYRKIKRMRERENRSIPLSKISVHFSQPIGRLSDLLDHNNGLITGKGYDWNWREAEVLLQNRGN